MQPVLNEMHDQQFYIWNDTDAKFVGNGAVRRSSHAQYNNISRLSLPGVDLLLIGYPKNEHAFSHDLIVG